MVKLEAPGPLNLVAGTILAQVSIVGILFIGSIVLQVQKWRSSVLIILLSVLLVLLILLLTSDAFARTWEPLFGKSIGWIDWHTAVFICFVLDVLLVSYFVYLTGGSHHSPFQSLYFLVPTLSIFLREPVAQILLYTEFVVISFTFCMISFTNSCAPDSGSGVYLWGERPGHEYHRRHKVATWLVSTLCFLVAVGVGILTRPT